MKGLQREQILGFFTGLSCAAGGIVWGILYPTNAWQTLVITAVSAAMWFLPWKQWGSVRLLPLLLGVGVASGGSVDLLSAVFSDISRWQWWLALGILVFFLTYVGWGGVLPGATAVGLVTAFLLLLSFAGAVGQYDGVIEWGGGSFQRAVGGIVALGGCSLCASETRLPPTSTRLGALSGIGLWCLSMFIPMILWSGEALDGMSLPLVRSWQRIGMGAPDVWLTTAVCVCAVWQCSVGLLSVIKLTSLQKQ